MSIIKALSNTMEKEKNYIKNISTIYTEHSNLNKNITIAWVLSYKNIAGNLK